MTMQKVIDILANWKTSRFIVADSTVTGIESIIIIVLSDFNYWIPHFDALLTWCELYGGTVKGSTVELTTEEQLTMFALRWS